VKLIPHPWPLSSLRLGKKPEFLLAGEGSITREGALPPLCLSPPFQPDDNTSSTDNQVGEGDKEGEVEMPK
jgi:hypothetical protein